MSSRLPVTKLWVTRWESQGNTVVNSPHDGNVEEQMEEKVYYLHRPLYCTSCTVLAIGDNKQPHQEVPYPLLVCCQSIIKVNQHSRCVSVRSTNRCRSTNSSIVYVVYCTVLYRAVCL
jgi:hypothetical protein